MTNNEIFNTILHLTGLGLDKELTAKIFELGGLEATPSRVKGWRTEVGNDRATIMPDFALRGFLQGLFKYREMQEKKGIQIFNLVKLKRKEPT